MLNGHEDLGDAEIMLFGLNDQEYVAPMMKLENVLAPEFKENIPEAPEFIEGIINYRNRVIAIMVTKQNHVVLILSNLKELLSSEPYRPCII